MNVAFSGGLVYEFTQEPNNYGLVQILPNKDVRIMRDFLQFKTQLSSLSEEIQGSSLSAVERRKRQHRSSPRCDDRYSNLDVSRGIPESLAGDLIRTGVRVKKGKYVELSAQELVSPFKVLDVQGNSYLSSPRVETREIINVNWTISKPKYSTTAVSGMYIDFLRLSYNTNVLLSRKEPSFAIICYNDFDWNSLVFNCIRIFINHI